MTQEQKARAYDRAFEEAESIHRLSSNIAEIKRMEQIFPELKMSEDERIRKDLIQYLYSLGALDNRKYINWLEKQGEKSLTVDIESMIEAYEQRLLSQCNGVRNSPFVNMCVEAFKHGVENTLDELHLKQGEQKPFNYECASIQQKDFAKFIK